MTNIVDVIIYPEEIDYKQYACNPIGSPKAALHYALQCPEIDRITPNIRNTKKDLFLHCYFLIQNPALSEYSNTIIIIIVGVLWRIITFVHIQ